MPGQGYDFSDDDQGTLEQQGYDEVPEPPQPRTRPGPETDMHAAESGYYEPEQQQMQVVDVQPGDEETTDEDYRELVSHVDRRLRIAQNFRLVLDSPLFGEETPESRVVQSRIRKFVREEIEVLFGMKAASSMSSGSSGAFTAEEVDALKALAAATISAKKRTAEPKLNRIAAPPPVQAPPAAVKPIQAAPVRPIQQPRQQPVQAPPQQRTQPRPPTQPQQPQSSVKPGTLPNNVAAGTPGLKTDPRVPDDYKNDPTVRIKNGHVYVQQRDNSSGELLWVQEPGMRRPIPMLKDITPISKPSGPIQPVPMPNVESMSMLTNQTAATEAMQNLERLAIKMDPVFRGSIGLR